LITFAAPPVTDIALYGHDIIVVDLSIGTVGCNREIAGMMRDEHPNSGFERRIENSGDIHIGRSEDSKLPPSAPQRRNEQTRNDDILGRAENIGGPATSGKQRPVDPTFED